MLKRLRASRGETIVETLVAILIVALSALMMLAMLTAAARINSRVHEADDRFRQALNINEGRSGAATPSTANVTAADAGADTYSYGVTLHAGEGGPVSYALVASPGEVTP